MEWIIWLVIMVPVSSLFTGIGIFAWKKKKPMSFWSGTSVREEEISDIPAYNRANGIMWICYSLVFWLGTVLGLAGSDSAGPVLLAGCLGGLPLLVFAYGRIYDRYKTPHDPDRPLPPGET